MEKMQQGYFDMNPPIVFFHGDFSLRNMLVEGTTLTALLDWEWSGAFPVDNDWDDNILADLESSEDVAIFWEEVDKLKELLTPRKIPGYDIRKKLRSMIECLAPWQVGCFSPEEDLACVEESHKALTDLLQFLETLPEKQKA